MKFVWGSVERHIRGREAKIEELQRVIRCKDIEIEHLAAICARDRMRQEAETAIHARVKADAEGSSGRDPESIHIRSA